MSKVSFRILWIMWATRCAYDGTISLMGVFPIRSFSDRFEADFMIAYFVMSARIVVWLIDNKPDAPPSEEDAG